MNSTQTLIGVGIAAVVVMAAMTVLVLRELGRKDVATQARAALGDAVAVARLENEGGHTSPRSPTP